MHFITQSVHWLLANAQSIYYLLAAVSVFVAVLTYRKNSALERARWLSSLYSKFYEALDLKRIRQALDENSPNSAQIRELVQQQDSGFTDYLNFFEFMAYLEACGQLSRKDVAALFDYYVRVLSKHEDVREYVRDDRNGYGYLKKFLPRFSSSQLRVQTITDSDHDSSSFCVRHSISATCAAGDRRHRPPASAGGASVCARPVIRSWEISRSCLE